jgi:hypothetical protein
VRGAKYSGWGCPWIILYLRPKKEGWMEVRALFFSILLFRAVRKFTG